MNPGIYEHLSNADYHGGAGDSKSGLDLIHKSPLHYKFATTAANENEATPAQKLGTAFHCLLLEPGEFVKNYTLSLRRSDVPEAIEDRDVLVNMVHDLNSKRLPKLPTGGNKGDLVDRIVTMLTDIDAPPTASDIELLKTMKLDELKAQVESLNKGRAGHLAIGGSRHELAEVLRANGVQVTLWSDVLEQWISNNGHRIILTQDEWDQLHAMRDSVMAHPAANALLTKCPGKAEMSFYWVDPITGLLLRCRPDFLREDGVIVDVKTTDDASQEAFSRSIEKWRYHVQATYYLDGVAETLKQMKKRTKFVPPRAFVFLVVEKKPPYAVAVYTLDTASMNLGRAEYRQDLDVLAQCKKLNQWPGYGDKIQTIGVPQWALNKGAHLIEGDAA